MSAALRAELTKLRTVSTTAWLPLAIAVLTIAATAAVDASTHVSSPADADPTKLALVGVYFGQVVAAMLGVLAVAEEFGTEMIRVSLVAVPRRGELLLAKAAGVGGLALIAALPAVAGSLLVGHLLLPDAGIDPAHGYPTVSIAVGPTLRAAVGSVLYLGLVALIGLGVATMVRDTAASVGAVIALLFLPLIFAAAVGEPLHRHVLQVAPMSAGLAIQSTMKLASLPIGPWAGLGVTAAWALGALALGAALLRYRDA